MRKLWGLAAVVGLSFGVSGCKAPSDIGKECVLIRADPTDDNASDGIRNIPITEGEINVNQDYVAFGATECEDLVCVRRAGAPITGNQDADATGICSKPCIPEADLAEQCPPADDSLKLSCRALILDEATIAAICQSDPQLCQDTFGDNRSPDFCVEAVGG